MEKYYNSQSVDSNEMENFSNLKNEWWVLNGKFKALHDISEKRVEYILKIVKEYFDKDYSNISILDVGCGGGIVSESLSALGFKVKGIDVLSSNIEVAKDHMKESNLNIDYECISIEDFFKNNTDKFDIVLNMDVIEHVKSVDSFLKSSLDCIDTQGIYIASTINKTIKAKVFAKYIAEYVLKWLDKGTHDYEKFIKPSVYQSHLNNNNFVIEDLCGISFDLLSSKWFLSTDVSMNYLLTAKKKY